MISVLVWLHFGTEAFDHDDEMGGQPANAEIESYHGNHLGDLFGFALFLFDGRNCCCWIGRVLFASFVFQTFVSVQHLVRFGIISLVFRFGHLFGRVESCLKMKETSQVSFL